MDQASPTSETRNPRNNMQAPASTDAPQVLRRTAPYNLRSMRDLYTQIPDRTATLKRFGSEVFISRSSSSAMRELPTRTRRSIFRWAQTMSWVPGIRWSSKSGEA